MDLEASKASLACAIQHARLPFDWAEFGVATGDTARFLLEHMPPYFVGFEGGLWQDRLLWLFDSYQGLPAPWRHLPRGAFQCPRPDLRDHRARYVTGRFEETVFPWALDYSQPLGLVHIDCDLYESTRAVLQGIRILLHPGTIIAFDEFQNGPHDEEKRAWEDSGIQGSLLYSKQGRTVWRVLTA